EIIRELEPVPRDLYTGALGWFGFNGESQFNIAIRTMVVERGCAHFHAGAGFQPASFQKRGSAKSLIGASPRRTGDAELWFPLPSGTLPSAPRAACHL